MPCRFSATHLRPELPNRSREVRSPGMACPIMTLRVHGQALYGHYARRNGQDVRSQRATIFLPTRSRRGVKYLFAKAVGPRSGTYVDCIDFWGKDTRQCDPMKELKHSNLPLLIRGDASDRPARWTMNPEVLTLFLFGWRYYCRCLRHRRGTDYRNAVST